MQSKWWCLCLMLLAATAGLSSLCLAFREDHWPALIAAALAAFWSGLAAGLLVVGSGTRRTRTQTSDRAVNEALDYLVEELNSERDLNAKDAPTKAELVDRLHSMALKALDKSDTRSL